ncbi:hypothetical protein KSS87_012238 [Heliosperma pusillum]|nr:hypothetical protein KSS87_012238 [Heliosperma pusillum]
MVYSINRSFILLSFNRLLLVLSNLCRQTLSFAGSIVNSINRGHYITFIQLFCSIVSNLGLKALIFVD